MMEVIFELLSTAVDYTYLLYLYVKLIGEEWNFKKASICILLITCVQYMKETIIDFYSISIFIDYIFVISFLFLYTNQKNFKNFVFAMVFNTVFGITVLMFASIAVFIGVDVGATLNFGVERIMFSIFIKLFTII